MAKAPSAIARLDPWLHGPAVTRLFADAFANANAPAASRMGTSTPGEWAIDEDAVGLVWLDSGQVCGAVTALPSPWSQDTWIIANLVTDLRFRRRGIARALLVELIRICISKGAASFQLQVDSNNSPAVSLYTDMGFIQVSEMIVARPSTKTPFARGGQNLTRLATHRDMRAVNELLRVTYGQDIQYLEQWQAAMNASMPLKAFSKTSKRIYITDSAVALVTTEKDGAHELVTTYPVIVQSMPASSAANFIGAVLAQHSPAASAHIEFCTTTSDLVCQMALSKLGCTTIRRTQIHRRLSNTVCS